MSSKYSLYGSNAFDRRVDADMASIIEAVKSTPAGKDVRSIILLGGYGRGEGTPFRVGGREVPFNDYDLVVVMDSPSKHFVQHIPLLERRLSGQLGIAVDLYPHTASSLKRAEFSLLNYEMQKGHQVLWGPEDALGMMPEIHLENIPLSEGTRLLLNRGKLLLDIQCRLRMPEPLDEEETIRFRKFIWKNHLAFGDCALLALKEYDVLYQVKEKRIERFKNSNAFPEDSTMISAYLRAVEFKQRGKLELLPGPGVAEEWRKARAYWLRFFLWFEGVRLGIKLESVEGYCAQLIERENSGVKSLLRNGWHLGWRAIHPSSDWLWVHPRNRLYPALYILLSEGMHTQTLQQLLGQVGNIDTLRQRFYSLRSRLS